MVVQAYAPTSSQDDEELERFYEDVDLAMRKVQGQHTAVMGDFKSEEMQPGEQAISNYTIDSRNTRGEMLVEIAERNRPRIMNTLLNRKGTWRNKERNRFHTLC